MIKIGSDIKHIRPLTQMLATVMSALMVSACEKHVKEPDKVEPSEINLTIELSTAPSSTDTDAVAFAIELHKGHYEGELVLRHDGLAIKDADGKATIKLNTSVPAGNYRLAAFAANASSEDPENIMYDMTDFRNITFSNDTYAGSTPFKECYDLRMDINLSGDTDSQTVTGQMKSPTGRVEIISEDAADFSSNVMSRLPAYGRQDSNTLWEDFCVRWTYSMYFPTGYDVYSGYPGDTGTDVYFESGITPLSDNEVMMGYDYVLVNGERTSVEVSLEVYNRRTGETVSTFSGLKADITKGQSTVIRGDFLTVDQGSGVGIDSDFDAT